jgi:HK97 gp10 family phage protein
MPTATATFNSNAVMRRDDLGRFISQIERGGERLMSDLANDFEDRARRYAPMRTGRLRRSIKALIMNGYREVRVVSDVPYAEYMESGTRPHRISGVRANFRFKNGTQFFRWVNYKYGPYGTNKFYENWSFPTGATVRHPGTKAHYFFRRAYRETMADARVTMRKAYQ